MARKDALLRIHQRLVQQRDELRRKLEFQGSTFRGAAEPGDAGDIVSFDTEQEAESRLVSLETRELARIECAIQAIQDGTYGRCEFCSDRIPVARLNAVPHTTSCVRCQEKLERRRTRNRLNTDWESACEFEAREADRELTPQDIRFDGS
ncbi:MAG: TraR/DksA C4-type zinc finger protein [Planctomycetaceae bacterium]|nr:TraR/DksA C4-type zinc finger protein [Planctomycetaceae bacterium]